jgi:hypothetical protein
VSGRPSFDENQLREAIASSLCYSEVLRKLRLRAAGGNHRTIQKYVRLWAISTAHFDPNAARARATRNRAQPLAELLVVDSTYSRGHLKQRLYAAGLKERECEMCGQGEEWNGLRIALILDHINGVATDNRLENLRIVCPNCAAGLPTHCGRNIAMIEPRTCIRCGASFRARKSRQTYCSKRCGVHAPPPPGPRPERRKVERPPVRQLLREIAELGYVAVGHKYGVSDNAIRKWLRAEGVTPPRIYRRRGAELADRQQLHPARIRIRVRHLRDRDDLECAAAVARECLQLLQ